MVFIFWYSNEKTIITIGDAINSFLQEPDAATDKACLISRETANLALKAPKPQYSRRFEQIKKQQWRAACSKRH